MSHNAMMKWAHVNGRYEPGWYIGSEGENGEHLPHAGGWPFSIYRQSAEIGVSDMVLCHGIQDFDDAVEIASRLMR